MNHQMSIKSLFTVAFCGVGLAIASSACTAADEEAALDARSEDTSGVREAVEGPVGEASQALNGCSSAVFSCLNGGQSIPGTLTVNVTPNGTFCSRSNVVCSGDMPPPPVDPSLPSCWGLAKQLGCLGF